MIYIGDKYEFCFARGVCWPQRFLNDVGRKRVVEGKEWWKRRGEWEHGSEWISCDTTVCVTHACYAQCASQTCCAQPADESIYQVSSRRERTGPGETFWGRLISPGRKWRTSACVRPAASLRIGRLRAARHLHVWCTAHAPTPSRSWPRRRVRHLQDGGTPPARSLVHSKSASSGGWVMRGGLPISGIFNIQTSECGKVGVSVWGSVLLSWQPPGTRM